MLEVFGGGVGLPVKDKPPPLHLVQSGNKPKARSGREKVAEPIQAQHQCGPHKSWHKCWRKTTRFLKFLKRNMMFP